MSAHNFPRTVVASFTVSVIIVIFLVLTLFDRAKLKLEESDVLPDLPAPSFPVPAIPGQSRITYVQRSEIND
jgi:hypothetical protein